MSLDVGDRGVCSALVRGSRELRAPYGATTNVGVEHIALFYFNSVGEYLAYAEELADLIEDGSPVTSIPYYWKVWGPGDQWPDASQWYLYDAENERPRSALMETLADYEDCKGFYLAELYSSAQIISATGIYRNQDGYSAEAYLLGSGEYEGILEIVKDKNEGIEEDKNKKKVLWHEPGWMGPGGFGDGEWKKQRVGWWGFALYDTDIYNSLFDNPEYKDVIVQMHEDIQFTADTANLGTVFGTWLASPNRSRWGASLQGFWWYHTQTRQAVNEYEIRVRPTDALYQLDVEDALTNDDYNNYSGKFFRLFSHPGQNPDEANWAEIPPDLTARQILQCLGLGATVFQFEHSPYVLNHEPASALDVFDDNFTGADDGSGGKAGGIKPVMEMIQSEGLDLKIPAKSAVRHLCGLPLFLDETDTSGKEASYFWVNEDSGHIEDNELKHLDLGPENNWKFGIFVPDYHVLGYNDQGENILADPVMPSDSTTRNYRGWLHPSYAARFEPALKIRKDPSGKAYDDFYFPREAFSNDAYKTDQELVPTLSLAEGWIEDGTSDGVITSDIGHDTLDGLRDYMAQKIVANATMEEDYTLHCRVQLFIPFAGHTDETTCKMVLSASATGDISGATIQFAYYKDDYTSTPPESDWADITTDASGEWHEFETGEFSVPAATPEVTLWLRIQEAADLNFTLRVDDLMVMATDGDVWYPITANLRKMQDKDYGCSDFGRKVQLGSENKFNQYYLGDFLVPEIIDDGTAEWAFGDYYVRSDTSDTETDEWTDWLKKYGVYTDPENSNISSATAYSCEGEYFDIHRHYFSIQTYDFEKEPFSKDDSNPGAESVMSEDAIPLPQPEIIDATTPKGLNRYFYRYTAHQKRNTDCLLADSRYGFIPLVPEGLAEDDLLPSTCKQTSTNGMDIKLDAWFDADDEMEPIEFGEFLEFLDDSQTVSVLCKGKNAVGQWEDREVNVTMTAIGCTDKGGGIYETEYQLILFDAVEGGIEISPATRKLSNAVSGGEILNATVTVNLGLVTEFVEKNALEDESEDSKSITAEQVFTVDLPRYYYDIIRIKDRKLK